jgi:hypothetical protein
MQPNFARVLIETRDGELHDGVVVATTPTSLTLRS